MKNDYTSKVEDYWEPRTDREMLLELKQKGEGKHLDYKRQIDFSGANRQATLNFVKDVVAMANTHPGGHIIVGLENDGSLPKEKVAIEAKLFDGATLTDRCRRYIKAEINIESQIHEIDEHTLVIIAIYPSINYYPILMEQDGEYEIGPDHKKKTVFRKGLIYLREGSQNVVANSHHIPQLLAAYGEKVRKHTEESVSRAFSLNQFAGFQATTSPISMNLPTEEFAISIRQHLQVSDLSSIRMLTRQIINGLSVSDNPDISKLSTIIIEAIFAEKHELVIELIDSLFTLYTQSLSTEFHLDIATNLYAIGSAVVRAKQWELLKPIVLHTYPSYNNEYLYKSWIRHAQTMASREDRFDKQETGLMISRARALMSAHPELRPDILEDFETQEIPPNDPATNSLCEFDFLQVLIQELPDATGKPSGNPSCATYSQNRLTLLFTTFVDSSEIRKKITGYDDETIIKDAFKTAYDIARSQSATLGHWWLSPISAVKDYLSH